MKLFSFFKRKHRHSLQLLAVGEDIYLFTCVNKRCEFTIYMTRKDFWG